MLEWVRARYRVWDDGGPPAMAREVWHPDVVYHDAAEWPERTVVRGADALATHLVRRFDGLGGGKFEVRDAWWIREGEVFLVELSVHATGEASGVALDATVFQIVRVAEGRSVEVWDYLTREQAFEAAQGHV